MKKSNTKRQKNTAKNTAMKLTVKYILVFSLITVMFFAADILLPLKTSLTIFLTLFIALTILSVYTFSLKNPKNKVEQSFHDLEYVFVISACLCSILTVNAAESYAFANGKAFPFWEFGLLAGIICGFLLFIFVVKPNKCNAKANLVYILTYIAVVFISFLLITYLIENLNYLLDTDNPQEYTETIEDTEIIRHSRGSDTYSFHFTVDGEKIILKVKYSDYKKYETGDTYTFKKYNGAFGVPFYVSE